jgi:3-isopropylmalate/(R)-2-methylmalate dehydratase large subunit
MGKTIAEKIFSEHCRRNVAADEIVVAPVDSCMGTDGSSPLAIQCFNHMGGTGLHAPQRVVFSLDHYAPSPNEKVSFIHKGIVDFARKHGACLYNVGEGISHQLMVEKGHVLPGMLVFGADSHSCTYGAVNAFGSGVGSSDLAAIMISGELWFRVPRSIRIGLEGAMPAGLYSKDVILWVFAQLGDQAVDRSIEFCGTAVDAMTMASRLTLSNMVTEIGAVAGIMNHDDSTRAWLAERNSEPYKCVFADADAPYDVDVTWDVSAIVPQIAVPDKPDNVVDISEAEGTRVDQAFIGTCTNGRLEDLRIVGAFLRKHDLDPRVRTIIGPASRRIYAEAAAEGLLELFARKGAILITPGCGPCCGTGAGVPGDGETVITTMNRNFKGRMGNTKAAIYLGSPASVIAAAITGEITDPRRLA